MPLSGAESAEASEPRVVKVDPSNIKSLGYGELLDAGDLAGVDVTAISQLSGNTKLRFFLAVAYVTVRRNEPGVTWAEAQRWKVEVEREPKSDPTPMASEQGEQT